MTRLAILFVFFWAYGQNEAVQAQDASYYMDLEQPNATWHRIELPIDMHQYCAFNFRDLRIEGLTSTGDTIEAPYVLDVLNAKKVIAEQVIKAINPTRRAGRYYYTFHLSGFDRPINHITLDIDEDNYQYDFEIEGSNDGRTWYAIDTSFKVLAINNAQKQIELNELSLPNLQYEYFRLSTTSQKQAKLSAIRISQQVQQASQLTRLPSRLIKEHIEKDKPFSQYYLELPQAYFINELHFNVQDTFDFQRPIRIYTGDSLNDPRERAIFQGRLHSESPTTFSFRTIIAKFIRVEVQNGPNEALDIDSLNLYAYRYQLRARFTDLDASYRLTFAQPGRGLADYDIAAFKDKIPRNPSLLTLGPIQESSLFKPKPSSNNWPDYVLWIVLALGGALIAWFAYRMMKESL